MPLLKRIFNLLYTLAGSLLNVQISMKKFYLLLVLSTGLYAQALAQSQIKLGVKAGVAIANYRVAGADSDGESASARTAYYGGVTVDVPLGGIWSLQPGVLLVSKGAQEKESASYSEGSLSITAKIDAKVAPLYLEIPINILANIELSKGKLILGGGPYLGA